MDVVPTADESFERRLPGAAGREHPVLADAGHLVQEDAGPVPAGHVLDFVGGRR